MSTLIIIAGLPGVGKSHTARLLKKSLPKAYYFDSDLFAKNYAKAKGIVLGELSSPDQKLARLKFHRAKIDKLRQLLKKYKVAFLDTCFDMMASRKIFYEFVKDENIELVVLEIKCPSDIVKQRIFENKHEVERMIGTPESRWKTYKEMKAYWKPIRKSHSVIRSNKPLLPQLANIIKRFK